MKNLLYSAATLGILAQAAKSEFPATHALQLQSELNSINSKGLRDCIINNESCIEYEFYFTKELINVRSSAFSELVKSIRGLKRKLSREERDSQMSEIAKNFTAADEAHGVNKNQMYMHPEIVTFLNGLHLADLTRLAELKKAQEMLKTVGEFPEKAFMDVVFNNVEITTATEIPKAIQDLNCTKQHFYSAISSLQVVDKTNPPIAAANWFSCPLFKESKIFNFNWKRNYWSDNRIALASQLAQINGIAELPTDVFFSRYAILAELKEAYNIILPVNHKPDTTSPDVVSAPPVPAATSGDDKTTTVPVPGTADEKAVPKEERKFISVLENFKTAVDGYQVQMALGALKNGDFNVLLSIFDLVSFDKVYNDYSGLTFAERMEFGNNLFDAIGKAALRYDSIHNLIEEFNLKEDKEMGKVFINTQLTVLAHIVERAISSESYKSYVIPSVGTETCFIKFVISKNLHLQTTFTNYKGNPLDKKTLRVLELAAANYVVEQDYKHRIFAQFKTWNKELFDKTELDQIYDALFDVFPELFPFDVPLFKIIRMPLGILFLCVIAFLLGRKAIMAKETAVYKANSAIIKRLEEKA